MPAVLKWLVLLFVPLTGTIPGTLHAASTTIGVSGDKFTVNSSPTFLLGVSYFDTLGWKTSDLDALQRRGFNLIRIWLDWRIWMDRSQSIFDANGSIENTRTILGLVRATAARGIVVDVTILNSCSVQGGACASSGFQNTDIAKSAIQNAVNLLKKEPNVFFDLVNERDNDVRTWTTLVMTDLVSSAKRQAPNSIITFSDTGDLDDGSETVDGELKTGIDVVSPHFPRTRDWYDQTDQRVNAIKSYLVAAGRTVPVYLQEENRRRAPHVAENPSKQEFFQAAREAMSSGAAGWIFHTDAGFDLSGSKTFFGNLDSVERGVVDGLSGAISGGGTEAELVEPAR